MHLQGKKQSSTDEGKQGEDDDALGDMTVVSRGSGKPGRSGLKSVRASVAGYPTHNGNKSACKYSLMYSFIKLYQTCYLC